MFAHSHAQVFGRAAFTDAGWEKKTWPEKKKTAGAHIDIWIRK